MSALWTMTEAKAATGGVCAVDWQANGVSIDTRSLQKGDIFVALSATRDGHDFVADALNKGAAAALVSRIPAGLEQAPLLVVPDVLAALVKMGMAARHRCAGKVVAITGSVGKTGSKEMLRCALHGQGRVHVAEKSYNNHEGVPLTLARMPRDTEFAVIEIGMNHPGEIAPLARMAMPHVAVVTNVAPVHLEAFDGLRDIAKEKAAIFEGLVPNGIAIVNSEIADFDVFEKMAPDDIITFGKNADFNLLKVEISNGVTVVQAQRNGQKIVFKLNTEGQHLAMNALGVLASVEALGGDIAKAMLGLLDWQPPEGRGACSKINLGPAGIDGSFVLIDESYNANPASVGAALAVLGHAKGRRVAVLGDMLELGVSADSLHQNIAKLASIKDIDMIHCVGPKMALFQMCLPAEKRGLATHDSAAMAAQIKRVVRSGDVIMVKGSLGIKMALIVDALTNMGEATTLVQSMGKP